MHNTSEVKYIHDTQTCITPVSEVKYIHDNFLLKPCKLLNSPQGRAASANHNIISFIFKVRSTHSPRPCTDFADQLTVNSPPTRDARGVPLGSSNGAHHHRRSDHHIHVQRAATMGTAALTSEVLPPLELCIHVRVVDPDSKELLPGSEGSRLCTS